MGWLQTVRRRGGCVTRKDDVKRILNEVGGVRQALEAPDTGLTAFHQNQEDMRRKVLESIAMGTTGLREENRELRRRQERMLSDLADVRTAVEALRRELAQAARAHPAGAPNTTSAPSTFALGQRETPLVKTGGGNSDSIGWEDAAVDEGAGPDGRTDAEPTQQQQHDRQDEVPTARLETEPSAGPAEPAPAPASPPAGTTVASQDEGDEGWRKKERLQHIDGVLAAASIASARLVCHRDTWDFLIEQVAQHPHFRLPDRIGDVDGGQIETHLSGRSLLAVLVSMRKVHQDHAGTDEDMATWALASAVYHRTRGAVLAAKLPRPQDSEVVTIVLDDRPDTAD
jgi:hypothetical protein